MKVVVYQEPRKDGDYLVKVSVRDAINKQTESSIDRLGFDVYLSEADALEDFCVIYWARLEEGEPGAYNEDEIALRRTILALL